MIIEEMPRRRVAIVAGDAAQRERLGQEAILAGFQPVPLERNGHDVDGLVRSLAEADVYGVLCDQRLGADNGRPFDGAEVVAALYGKATPAILVTDPGDEADGSIKRHRRQIPVVIPADELRPGRIVAGVKDCELEVVFHDIPLDRRPRMALVMIDEVVGDQVNVFVTQWDPNQMIVLPIGMIPERLHSLLRKDEFLLAWANTDAERIEDLYFDDFQPLLDGDAAR